MLDQCGACMAGHVDTDQSESFVVLVKIAATFSSRCAQPVEFAGNRPQFSSALEAIKTQQGPTSTSSMSSDGAATTDSTTPTTSPTTAATSTRSEDLSGAAPSGAASGSNGAAGRLCATGGWMAIAITLAALANL